MSRNKLRRGCNAQSTVQRQKRIPTPPSLQLQQIRLTKCSNVRHRNTVGRAKSYLYFLIISIKWVVCLFCFFLLNHILWFKSQSLLRASSRTHSSLKKSNKSNPHHNLAATLLWAAANTRVDPSLPGFTQTRSRARKTPAAPAFRYRFMISPHLQASGSLQETHLSKHFEFSAQDLSAMQGQSFI